MFWIGLIVGVVIMAICFIFVIKAGCIYMNVSFAEATEAAEIVATAGYNREAIITVTHNDEVLRSYTFEEM